MDDKNKQSPLNWNAGTNFNNIIEFIIESIIVSKIDLEWNTSLNLLNTLFNITYPKILSYGIKFYKTKEVIDKTKKIKVILENTKQIINYKKNNNEISESINKIEFLIYNLMGEYGVLFPFEEESNKQNQLTAYINQR